MFFPYISDCAQWLGPCGLVAPDGRACALPVNMRLQLLCLATAVAPTTAAYTWMAIGDWGASYCQYYPVVPRAISSPGEAQ